MVLLEPEGDVELKLLPEPVELAAEAERDCAAGVADTVLNPETKMLAVAHRRDVAELATGHEQGNARVGEPERRQARKLGTEIERQLRAVHERVDHRARLQLLLGKTCIGVHGKGLRKGLDLSGLDREPRSEERRVGKGWGGGWWGKS